MKTMHYIPTEGADKGKVFVITRMSAFQADQWARRLIKAIARTGKEVSEDHINMGILGLTGITLSIYGRLEDDITERSLNELLSCVKIIRDPRLSNMPPMEIMEEDFEDPKTLQKIYEEAFKLNVDFLKAAASLISPLAAACITTLKQEIQPNP